MKVCTDACIFGAYVAKKIRSWEPGIKNCLDIGAGTGLLSLMLAQKNDIIIDAVEIDMLAYRQAKQNFELSPWKNRLIIFNSDILSFKPHKKYDLIISNPPFFENNLKSENPSSNAAKHDTLLTLNKLIPTVSTIITENGLFAVLLPHERINSFEREIISGSNFYCIRKLLLKQTSKHNFFRGILIFSATKSDMNTEELTIKSNAGNYTGKFRLLLKDYYLYL